MIVVIVVVVLIAICLAIGIGIMYLYTRSHLAINQKQMPSERFDVVAFHSYKPPKGIVPERGRRVARTAVEWARHYQCPILLSIGNTLPGYPMESKIYADYIRKNLANDVPIITARSPAVRDTDSEIKSSYEYCVKAGYQKVAIVGAYPHLGSRIIRYWSRINRDHKLDVTFIGVYIPARYYFWELGMMLADWILAPGTKRRGWLLNFIGRRG